MAEVIGLASGILTLGEVGLRLSLKLYEYAVRVRTSKETINALAREISLTCSVLKVLGDTLSDDKYSQLCSAEAVSTAKGLVKDCTEAFKDIEDIVKPEAGKKYGIGTVDSIKSRLTSSKYGFPLRTAQIEEYQANIERLKSSLALILNVLIMVGLYKRPESMPIMVDQYRLVELLDEENASQMKRYNKLIQAAEEKKQDGGVVVSQSPNASLPVISGSITKGQRLMDVPAGMEHHREHIVNHGSLVESLLQEVSSERYKLGLRHRLELHDGILDIHWQSWSSFRNRYGHEAFMRLFADFKEVTSFWIDRQSGIPQSHIWSHDSTFRSDHPQELVILNQRERQEEKSWERDRDYGWKLEREKESEERDREDGTRRNKARERKREERAERERARRLKEERELWKLEQESSEREAKTKQEEYRRRLEDEERNAEAEKRSNEDQWKRELEQARERAQELEKELRYLRSEKNASKQEFREIELSIPAEQKTTSGIDDADTSPSTERTTGQAILEDGGSAADKTPIDPAEPFNRVESLLLRYSTLSADDIHGSFSGRNA